MDNISGVIYILTNPSFPQYVKIGYADDVQKRLQQLNRSECTPFAFRIYATYEVDQRLDDLKLHRMIDQINPALRSIDDVDGKKRVREFYAMSPETAYGIFETIAELSGRRERLHLYEPTAAEKESEEVAQDIEEQHRERLSPFTFSKCNIPIGATLIYVNRGSKNSGVQCVVVDDKTVEYQGRKLSLSALATELTGGKWSVAGPRYFKYNGEWLNVLRAKAEGRQPSVRMDDVWVIPCNPKYYDIVSAFDNLEIVEWSQTNNVSIGDTVYIYVGGEYKAIMYKCEVISADLCGNRSNEDDAYYREMTKSPDARYMRLKLLEKYSPTRYPLKELKENGLVNVQGRSKATAQLMKYLRSNQ